MVVLTIVTQKNGDTVFLDQAIPQVHFMKLISCSLYNSWHNLTKVGQIYFKEDKECWLPYLRAITLISHSQKS